MSPSAARALFLILCGAMLAIGCAPPTVPPATVDAISGATPPTAPGSVQGLAGTIVHYDDTLVRGGEPDGALGMTALSGFGVQVIISVLDEPEDDALAAAEGLTRHQLPFEKDALDTSTLDRFAGLMEAAQGSRVYVHCHGGNHRAGALAMAWRIRGQGWDVEQAKAEFLAHGGDAEADAAMIAVIQEWAVQP